MNRTAYIGCALLMSLALALTACAAHKMESKPSGFLRDYQGLSKGRDDQAGLIWIKPGIKAGDYDGIVIDRVQTWIKSDTTFKGVDAKELDALTTFFSDALVREVGKVMPIAAKPGPKTLVLRTAITDIVPSNPVTGTLSSIVPIGIVASGATAAVTGEHIGVGEAAIEMELLDGATGSRLAAAVDRRSGTKAPFRGSLTDAEDACNYWAQLVGKRLAEFKNGTLRP